MNHSSRRKWLAAVILLLTALGIACFSIPLFECPSCAGLAKASALGGFVVVDSLTPLWTACPDCGDSGVVTTWKRGRGVNPHPLVYAMLQSPPLRGAPQGDLYGERDRTFRSSLEQLLAEDARQEAKYLLQELKQLHYYGQAEYTRHDGTVSVLCRWTQSASFRFEPWLCGFVLFDLRGRVLDTVRFRAESNASYGSPSFLKDRSDGGPVGEILIHGFGEVDCSLRHEGKETALCHPPVESGKGGPIRVGIRNGKLEIQSGVDSRGRSGGNR